MGIEESFKQYDEEVEKYEAKTTVKDYFEAGWKKSLEERKEYEEKLLKENKHLHNKVVKLISECVRVEKERHPEMTLDDQTKFRKHLNIFIDFIAEHEDCRSCVHFNAMTINILDRESSECTISPCSHCDWNSEWEEKK